MKGENPEPEWVCIDCGLVFKNPTDLKHHVCSAQLMVNWLEGVE